MGFLFSESEMSRLKMLAEGEAKESLSAHARRKRWKKDTFFLKGGRPTGKLGILRLQPCQTGSPPDKVIPFHKAVTLWKAGKRLFQHAIVHFFEEDYSFERLWNNPKRYLAMLKHYKYVIMPDFSMKIGQRPIAQMVNLDRNHLLGHWLQQNEVKLVPSCCWSGGASFSWCFSGLPEGGTFAISMTGCMGNDMSKSAFSSGLKALFKHAKPDVVWLFGSHPNQEVEDFISSHCKCIFINTNHYGQQRSF